MSIEESLAALLKAEVDKRVKAIEEAAGEAVRAFRLLAEQLAQGAPKVAVRPPSEPEIPQPFGTTQITVDDGPPAHMRVSGFASYQVTNEAASKANMSA